MPEKLLYNKFLESLKLAPRITIELLIENSDGAVLLLKRDKEPFVGFWHAPGGFLLKDEPIKDCIDRLAREEVGLSRVGNYDFLGYITRISEAIREVPILFTLYLNVKLTG